MGESFHVQAVVAEDGSLTIKGLPLHAGARVTIVVYPKPPQGSDRYPLRGTPFEYIDPFESVSEQDWAVLQE